MSIYSVNQVADMLGATAGDVIDAAGLTLGELEHAAGQHGLSATRYREVPVIEERHLEVIATRLDSPAAVPIACSECGRELGTVSSKPPAPMKCYACKTTPGNTKAGPASPAPAFDI
ncbi:hypothetical protein [Rhodococcus koreensis]